MIMSMRLKKLLALSLSVSLVSTGIFVDVGMRSVTAVASKTKQAKDKKNVKKVKVPVAQKKTIKAPKSEKKVVFLHKLRYSISLSRALLLMCFGTSIPTVTYWSP